jgi:hypothetical protein
MGPLYGVALDQPRAFPDVRVRSDRRKVIEAEWPQWSPENRCLPRS